MSMAKYDFSDIDNRIAVTESHLADEINWYHQQNSRKSVLFTVVGMLFFFAPQIYSFFTNQISVCEWYVWALLVAYLICGIASLICVCIYILPSKVSRKKSPKYFYTTLKEDYKAKQGLDDEQAFVGVKYSYLQHIDQCAENNRKLNNKKGDMHFWAYVFIFLTTLSYIFLVPYVLSHKKKEPLKVIVMTSDIKKEFSPEDTLSVEPDTVRREIRTFGDVVENCESSADLNQGVPESDSFDSDNVIEVNPDDYNEGFSSFVDDEG